MVAAIILLEAVARKMPLHGFLSDFFVAAQPKREN